MHHTALHARGFATLADEEKVEYDLVTADNGKIKASNVTGPGGDFVEGTPRPPPPSDWN